MEYLHKQIWNKYALVTLQFIRTVHLQMDLMEMSVQKAV